MSYEAFYAGLFLNSIGIDWPHQFPDDTSKSSKLSTSKKLAKLGWAALEYWPFTTWFTYKSLDNKAQAGKGDDTPVDGSTGVTVGKKYIFG